MDRAPIIYKLLVISIAFKSISGRGVCVTMSLVHECVVHECLVHECGAWLWRMAEVHECGA